MKRFAALLFAVGCLSTGTANAAPCAGFTDVDDTNAFCANVEWIKNRSVTLGCGAGIFCPGSPVLREQMAAFLNRLGNALEPTFAHTAQSGVSAQVNAAARVCVTTPVAITGYPRVASPVGSMLAVMATVTGGANFTAKLVYSTDGGTTFNNWSFLETTAGTHSGIYASMSPTGGPLLLDVGQTVVFAIQPNNFAGTTFDAACELMVRMDSRTGASTPF